MTNCTPGTERTEFMRCIKLVKSGDRITLLQPKEVEVFELRQQVFAIELIVIQKVLQGIAGLPVFIDAEKIFPLPLRQLDLQFAVIAEGETKPFVQLQYQLVIFHRGDDTQQPRVFEEVVGHIVYVQLKLHGLLVRGWLSVVAVKVTCPRELAPSMTE